VSAAALERATKRFGTVAALDDVTLTVEHGVVLALLGPNGAGKSTALALLLGLRRPDAGRALLLGADPTRALTRTAVGVALQETAYPATLRVRELIDLVRAHYDTPRAAAELAERFGLDALVARQVGGLSGGERRRVAVALAFAGDPRLVVLDEPTAGLDLDARRAVWEAIRRHAAGGGTILLTTHHLEEADALATRVVLIDAGRIVADGSPASIKRAAGVTSVSFRVPAGATIDGAERDGDRVRLLTADAGATVEGLVRANVPLVDLEVRALTLEESIAAYGRPA
jgi:ABC-2 type transport system ATP-binding protein